MIDVNWFEGIWLVLLKLYLPDLHTLGMGGVSVDDGVDILGNLHQFYQCYWKQKTTNDAKKCNTQVKSDATNNKQIQQKN